VDSSHEHVVAVVSRLAVLALCSGARAEGELVDDLTGGVDALHEVAFAARFGFVSLALHRWANAEGRRVDELPSAMRAGDEHVVTFIAAFIVFVLRLPADSATFAAT